MASCRPAHQSSLGVKRVTFHTGKQMLAPWVRAELPTWIKNGPEAQDPSVSQLCFRQEVGRTPLWWLHSRASPDTTGWLARVS